MQAVEIHNSEIIIILIVLLFITFIIVQRYKNLNKWDNIHKKGYPNKCVGDRMYEV